MANMHMVRADAGGIAAIKKRKKKKKKGNILSRCFKKKKTQEELDMERVTMVRVSCVVCNQLGVCCCIAWFVQTLLVVSFHVCNPILLAPFIFLMTHPLPFMYSLLLLVHL